MTIRSIVLFLTVIFVTSLASAKCMWDSAPGYCAQIDVIAYTVNKTKYRVEHCLISGVVKKFKRIYGNPRKEFLEIGEEIQISGSPDNCKKLKNLGGKTIPLKFEAVCNDVIINGKFGGPDYDFVSDQKGCTSAFLDSEK